jgi:hypothetical protein
VKIFCLKFANPEDGCTFALPSETVKRTADGGTFGEKKNNQKKFCKVKKTFYLCTPNDERHTETQTEGKQKEG